MTDYIDLHSITRRIKIVESVRCSNCFGNYPRPQNLFVIGAFDPEERKIVRCDAYIGKSGDDQFAEVRGYVELLNMLLDLDVSLMEATKPLVGIKGRYTGPAVGDFSPQSIPDAIGNTLRQIQRNLDKGN